MPEFRYAWGRIPESVAFISTELREFDTDYSGKSATEYRADRKLQKLMDRTVENILTALVEVCGTVLTQEGIAVDSYAEATRRCGGLLGLSEDEQVRLEKLAMQRNRLAHRYLDFRWQAVDLFRRERELIRLLLTHVLAREEARRAAHGGTA